MRLQHVFLEAARRRPGIQWEVLITFIAIGAAILVRFMVTRPGYADQSPIRQPPVQSDTYFAAASESPSEAEKRYFAVFAHQVTHGNFQRGHLFVYGDIPTLPNSDSAGRLDLAGNFDRLGSRGARESVASAELCAFAVDPALPALFNVRQNSGLIESYRIGIDGSLRPAGRRRMPYSDSLHNIDALACTGRYLYVAEDYGGVSGGLYEMPVRSDGSLGAPTMCASLDSAPSSIAAAGPQQLLYVTLQDAAGDPPPTLTEITSHLVAYSIGSGGKLREIGDCSPEFNVSRVMIGKLGRALFLVGRVYMDGSWSVYVDRIGKYGQLTDFTRGRFIDNDSDLIARWASGVSYIVLGGSFRHYRAVSGGDLESDMLEAGYAP